ncbi:hypothetical protein WJ41_19985 [Burkholderia ubonensis]|nr:hypothetical protein WJ41_19985 [Burkholderia ubonensis]
MIDVRSAHHRVNDDFARTVIVDKKCLWSELIHIFHQLRPSIIEMLMLNPTAHGCIEGHGSFARGS